MAVNYDAVEVLSSAEEEDYYQMCSMYTDVSVNMSDVCEESDGEELTSEEADMIYIRQEREENRKETECDFRRLADEDALLGIQLELGTPWLIVDLEGEVYASFRWEQRCRKEKATTEEHKSHFMLQCVTQGIRTELAPKARFGMLFLEYSGIKCVSLGRGRSNVLLSSDMSFVGPRESTLIRQMMRGYSPLSNARNCATNARQGICRRQESSDEEGSC